MAISLQGKTAIITGASSGIGRAMARALGQQGCRLVLAARSVERLEKLAGEIGKDVLVVPTDLSDGGQIDAMVEQTVARFGSLDILYANAGIFSQLPFADEDPDTITRLLDVNVDGVMRCAHAVLPHMRRSGSGDILVVSSIAGVAELRGEALYGASKHAVQTFTRILRRQVCADGVRVGAICPGTVATELWNLTDPDEIERRVEERTVLSAEDVVDASIYMLTRPANVTIRDLVILPQAQDI